MRFQIARAQNFYERTYPLIEMVEPESRPALWALIAIYRGILRSIERNECNVFARDAALTEMEKIGVVLRGVRMWLRHKAGRELERQQFQGLSF